MDEKDEYRLRWIRKLSKGQEGKVEGEMDEKDEYRGRLMRRMSAGED